MTTIQKFKKEKCTTCICKNICTKDEDVASCITFKKYNINNKKGQK